MGTSRRKSATSDVELATNRIYAVTELPWIQLGHDSWFKNNDWYREVGFQNPTHVSLPPNSFIYHALPAPMTKQQIQLVKQSWNLLREVDPALLGDVFYGRLFFKYPFLRPLFKGPMDSQYQKFIDMISLIVARIDRPDTMMSEIGTLARNHKGYDVKPFHFKDVKDALLWTLEGGLGNDWNDEVKKAWEACYDGLAKMILDQFPGES